MKIVHVYPNVRTNVRTNTFCERLLFEKKEERIFPLRRSDRERGLLCRFLVRILGRLGHNLLLELGAGSETSGIVSWEDFVIAG